MRKLPLGVSNFLNRPLYLSLCCFLIILFVAACASPTLEAKRMPGADLSGIKTIQVQKLSADERGINRVIESRLTKMGFLAADGSGSAADAVLTYQDKWMWDITMFMYQRSIQIRDGQTHMVLANGQSWRPSLDRKTPEEMVDEVLRAIFDGKGG